MIVEVLNGEAIVREAEDCRRLHVTTALPSDALDSVLRGARWGRLIESGTVLLELDRLRAAARAAARAPGWDHSFDRMVEYAAQHGWISSDGRAVRAHVEPAACGSTADVVSSAQLQPSADAMRDVLGRFASGVAVVTAELPEGPVGFTCQSLVSLSLDPPLISFSPARSSSTWSRIRAVGHFCVNILARDQQGHSARFASSCADRFEGIAWSAAPSGAPVLDGVLSWIDCSLRDEHDGGDHTIVIGEVRRLGVPGEREPLLYYRGRYGLRNRNLAGAA